MPHTSTRRLVALIASFMLIAVACSGSSDDADAVAEPEPEEQSAESSESSSSDASEPAVEADESATEPEPAPEPEPEPEPMFEGELIGLFAMSPTSCDGDDVSGSYFRMIQPEGDLVDGPFIPNGDSPCADGTYSAMSPGSDGGLRTDIQQLAPDPAFDESGNGLNSAIAIPVIFFGVDFALAIDGDANPPSIISTGGVLTGDMSGWSANYANLLFNQGAPKPDGSFPGLTAEVTGSINPETGAYVLEWSSQIIGGSFNDFTGVWHLEGTFTPA